MSRSWLASLLALALLLFTGTALAGGSIRLKSTDVQEVSGKWHVYTIIELPKAPPLAHVPMKFVFTKEAVFERALVDGSDKPVTNRRPETNPLPNFESLDIDFANAQGKIFKGTNFDFDLTRTRGYEAGEYKLEVRTADGMQVGSALHLTLRGDNEVVDRRSMTFNAKKSGVEKIGDGGTTSLPKGVDPNWQPPSQEVTPVGTADPFIPKDAYEKTDAETIKEKPGGCGCDVAGTTATVWSSAAGSLVLLLLFARRFTRKHARA